MRTIVIPPKELICSLNKEELRQLIEDYQAHCNSRLKTAAIIKRLMDTSLSAPKPMPNRRYSRPYYKWLISNGFTYSPEHYDPTWLLTGALIQTPELCWEVVKVNPCAIKHVKDQTPELCMMAVCRFPYVLGSIKNQTEELCLTAVRLDGMELRNVRHQTPAICMTAVKENAWALKYVENQTEEICVAAVSQDWQALLFVNRQTEKICAAALNKSRWALLYTKCCPRSDVKTSSRYRPTRGGRDETIKRRLGDFHAKADCSRQK